MYGLERYLLSYSYFPIVIARFPMKWTVFGISYMLSCTICYVLFHIILLLLRREIKTIGFKITINLNHLYL